MIKNEFVFGEVKTIFLVVLFWISAILCACAHMEELTDTETAKNPFVAQKEENQNYETLAPLVDAEEGEIFGGETLAETSMKVETKIYVHIAGAVKSPGVYALSAGSRVYEGIAAAGGFSEEANKDSFNLAEVLKDAQMIYIPRIGEDTKDEQMLSQMDKVGQNDSRDENVSGKININLADKETLMELSGIGEKRAEDILSYRKENGAFQKIEDIMNVPGIKEGAFSKIQEQIVVR